MGFTLAEKILARAAGLPTVRAGDSIRVKPDFVLAYELRGYTDVFFREMRELGVEKLREPERFGIFIDHRVPSKTPEDESLHVETRRWCAEQGVPLFERQGIGHQVAAEAGYAVPGALVVHFDGHVSQLGAFGTLALGLRAMLLEAFVLDTVPIRVPQTVLVRIEGDLSPGVTARDLFHHLLARFGPSFCSFKVLELAGSAVGRLSLESLQTMTGLAMFTGAVTAVVAPSPEALAHALPRARKKLEPVYGDADASYAKVLEVEATGLEPVVVVPPSPARTRPISEYAGTPVQAGYIGSCVSGRLEDLRLAAAVLRGRKVAPGFSLHVVPTSQDIMACAAREGLLATLIEAGAFLSSPSCDFCSGNIATIAAGQRAVSTGTLNVPGRMGHPDGEIFLCNAAAVAASAVEGRIADPRPYLRGRLP
jgi:3-isopropylmalate/(R)-2-methylmalate dehydratase large subunit